MIPMDRTTAIPALPNQGGQANVPGLRKLLLIETRHLLGLTDPRTVPGFLQENWLLTPTGLALAEDARPQLFRFPSDQGSYEQKAIVTVQGIAYSQSLLLTVAKDHPTTALIVQRMMGRRWVGVYEDANFLQKVIGTPKQPLRFSFSQKTNPNGFVFNWSTETRQPACFLTDNGLMVASDLDLSTEFSYGFTYDFFS
jgi:hypothetical protein